MSLKWTHAWHMVSTPAHEHVAQTHACLAHGKRTRPRACRTRAWRTVSTPAHAPPRMPWRPSLCSCALAVVCWLLVVGCWLLVVSCLLLAVSCFLVGCWFVSCGLRLWLVRRLELLLKTALRPCNGVWALKQPSVLLRRERDGRIFYEPCQHFHTLENKE